MTDHQILLATDVASTTCGRRPGFPMSWTLPVLAIAMAACTAGCGTANSDEYEAIDASQTASESPSPAKDSGTAAAGAVADSTQAGPADAAGVNSESETTEESKADNPNAGATEKVAATGESVSSASSEDGSATPAEVSPEEGSPETPGEAAEKTELAGVEPREIKLLVPERTFQTTGREQALRVTFDDVDLLKILNMEPVQENAPTLMPDWLKGLDGKRIRLRGFMYPTFQDTDIEVFLLARDNDICCFGRSPKVYDLVKVSMKDGDTTDYIEGRPFDVVGVFHIAEKASTAKGDLPKLYSMTDAVVISR
jgi:hypothetical protein